MPVPILDRQILTHRVWMEWQSSLYWCEKLRRFTGWLKLRECVLRTAVSGACLSNP